MLNRQDDPEKCDTFGTVAAQIVLLIGLPGAGKSHYAAQHFAEPGICGYSADVELHRSGVVDRATADALRPKIEQDQVVAARVDARHGKRAWLDHGFWSAAERREWQAWARAHGITLAAVWLYASEGVRWARVSARTAPFNARDYAEFEAWTAQFEPPAPDEIAKYVQFSLCQTD
jgi:predicted kinase